MWHGRNSIPNTVECRLNEFVLAFFVVGCGDAFRVIFKSSAIASEASIRFYGADRETT